MDPKEERTEHRQARLNRLSRREALRLLGIGVGGAALLTACGDNTATTAPAATTAASGGAAATTAASAATTAAGGSATTAAAGGASATKASGKVVVASPRDPTGTIKKIIADYNSKNTGITIDYQELPQDSTENKNKYTTVFAAKDPSIDVLASDIPWVPEFGSAGWLLPLDKYVTPDLKDQFYEGTIQGATYKDKLYGLPWYINVGMLYYRKDILDAAGVKPPETYADLEQAAAKLQKDGLYGFIFGAFQNEGLSANWLEILWGYGGEFWDPKTAEVTVNKGDNGVKALQWWFDNIYTRKISPDKVTGWKSPDIRNVFNEGNAVFMRDWADGYALTQANTSKVAGKVGIKPMVHAEGQKASGCLGNWYMAISNFSKNQDAAWEIVKYLTGPEGSKARALGTGLPPGNKEAYKDAELLAKYPYFGFLNDVLSTAKPRPVTPAYNQLSSDVIQVQVANVLSKKTSPQDAVKAMVDKGQPLLSKFK
ncbi:MAG TPA: ABC transporter substrate-binding protein [Chloroflexia bacterium]|nr:ABC transporter substrate-binding protein [Chloroflexia bacterium]